MKKLWIFLLCLLALLSGCKSVPSRNDGAADDLKTVTRDCLPEITPDKIARYILRYYDEKNPEPVDADTLPVYLTDIYGLEPDSWTDAAIYREGGASAFEIAVIRMRDPSDAPEAVKILENYIKSREGDFTGYAPEQAALVQNAKAVSSEYGDAALLIGRDADTAEIYFGDSYVWYCRWPFSPPHIDDMTCYDTTAILSAWESGDASGLSEKDSAILTLASQVLEQVTTENMTDYEKEYAVYDWITSNVTYDQDHYDRLAKLDPDSSNPYGPLHNGKGICLGFAVTFQLLMDMSDVECITVIGASFQSSEDHAWNMVRLNGEWYCVDATWDEGTGGRWGYFNVTSERMTGTDHQWDYENIPEAVAEDGGRGA